MPSNPENVRRNAAFRQAGVALIMALIILLVLTLIGVTAINMTSQEEKMAFNFQDRQLARYLGISMIQSRTGQNHMPNSVSQGRDQNMWNMTSADNPGLQQGTVSFTYIESTAVGNLASGNPKITRVEAASYATFRLHATATTTSGTTAEQVSAYYWGIPAKD